MLGHPTSDEGVDQRRLSGARRAADDREERCVTAEHARDHVVLELVDQLDLTGPLLVRAGQLEREAEVLESVVELGECRDQLALPTGKVSHRDGTTCPGNATNGRASAMRATYS